MFKIRIYSFVKNYGKNDDALDALMNCHSIISDSDKTKYYFFANEKAENTVF